MGNNIINNVGFISGFGPLVRGAKFVNAFSGNTSGTVDIYTCPAGKKALITQVMGISSPIMTGGLQLKISGNYYNFTAPNTIWGNVSTNSFGIVINPGEGLSFSVNSNPGGNLWARIMEMDISTPIYTARLLSLAAGDNTIFTVGAGKTAITLDTLGGAYVNGSGGIYKNFSGASRSIKVYHVPNGGSSGTANQYFQNTAVANSSGVVVPSVPSSMNSGDSIVINTDASTATQWVYMTYYEI